jgi:hypothetical protein
MIIPQGSCGMPVQVDAGGQVTKLYDVRHAYKHVDLSTEDLQSSGRQ